MNQGSCQKGTSKRFSPVACSWTHKLKSFDFSEKTVEEILGLDESQSIAAVKKASSSSPERRLKVRWIVEICWRSLWGWGSPQSSAQSSFFSLSGQTVFLPQNRRILVVQCRDNILQFAILNTLFHHQLWDVTKNRWCIYFAVKCIVF